MTTTRPHRAIISFLAFALVGCGGLIDGLLGNRAITDEEFCAAVQASSDKEAECRGAPPDVINCDEARCVLESRGDCPEQYDRMIACLLDDDSKTCDDIDIGNPDAEFCQREIEDYFQCAGLTDGNINCGGGNDGCDHDNQCEVGAGEDSNNCGDDCQCNFDTFCGPEEIPGACPDCGGGTPCNGDQNCDGGEDTATCPDCGGCNGNPTCEPGEPPTCNPCGGGSTCNNNSICDGPNEGPANCPNDCSSAAVCNGNGRCDPGENSVSCGVDCVGSCDHNSICDDHPSCSDCACNFDSICDGGETGSCSDCNPGAGCNVNLICDGAENNTSCGDCNGPCDKDATCDPGEENPNRCVDCSAVGLDAGPPLDGGPPDGGPVDGG